MEMQMAEQALVGGLGAQKIPITANTFRWILQRWRNFNIERGLPLPRNKSDYEFIFDKPAGMEINCLMTGISLPTKVDTLP